MFETNVHVVLSNLLKYFPAAFISGFGMRLGLVMMSTFSWRTTRLSRVAHLERELVIIT